MSLEVKSFDAPDDVRQFSNATVKLVDLAEGPVGHATYEPGWRWSTDVKPVVGTESCQMLHVGYVVSGRLKVVADDGSSVEIGPGDVFRLAPGHDAWTKGDEACVLIDFGGLRADAAPH